MERRTKRAPEPQRVVANGRQEGMVTYRDLSIDTEEMLRGYEERRSAFLEYQRRQAELAAEEEAVEAARWKDIRIAPFFDIESDAQSEELAALLIPELERDLREYVARVSDMDP